jgi:hypothetical protein
MPALAVTVLATMALCSGCGSSPEPLTSAQLVAKANSICRRVATRLAAVKEGEKISNLQQIAHVTRKLAGFEQSALGELGKLVPPAALETDWKRFIAGAQLLAEDTGTLSEAASTKDTATADRVIASAETTQKQMATIAKRNGIDECERVP